LRLKRQEDIWSGAIFPKWTLELPPR
jgi:hypothetical protein